MQSTYTDGQGNGLPLLFLDAEGNNTSPPLTEELNEFQITPEKPFKKWIDSFRTRRHHPIPEQRRKHVEGWSEPSEAGHEQRSERNSGISSSHLGTVESTTLSTTSRSVGRVRSGTQSTGDQSIDSAEIHTPTDGPVTQPNQPKPLDEAAENRAFKRRQVLQEIVATEFNYVLGLKVLSDVRPDLLCLLFHLQQAKPTCHNAL